MQHQIPGYLERDVVDFKDLFKKPAALQVRFPNFLAILKRFNPRKAATATCDEKQGIVCCS